MQAKKTPYCSVRYSASASGANFTTDCERSDNQWQYNWSQPNAPDGIWESNWKLIAGEWASSLGLNAGIMDSYSSNSRLLMQLVPSNFSLNPKLPSTAEALAVLAANTMIMGSENAPFLHFWNQTQEIISQPELQYFNASVSVMEYRSSATEGWQSLFYPVLILTFVTSFLCLVYLLCEREGQLTDFTEPLTLFTLAINSPATSRLEGACGAGPYGHQFKEKWYVGMKEGDEHYYIQTKADESSQTVLNLEPSKGPIKAKDPGPPPLSPALEEYRRYSNNNGWLARWY
ncbi:hypothetical protein ETB97_004170 [Aspergillus alliaceus]|uniref:Uncharacterized protein n=1 Tax=Petromyces alliaceus TaxID=209559 RepID=A0A8H6ACU5_PETAA|nr:hypothetical protein ETB97_004170 [Aspergillus burnettii]